MPGRKRRRKRKEEEEKEDEEEYIYKKTSTSKHKHKMIKQHGLQDRHSVRKYAIQVDLPGFHLFQVWSLAFKKKTNMYNYVQNTRGNI